MSESKTVVIDGGRIETVEDFYDEVERNVIGHRRWERDLTAFDEVLGDVHVVPAAGLTIRITEADTMEARIGHRLYVRILTIIRKHADRGVTLEIA